MVAHLHGGLGNAGDLMVVLFEVGQIAQDEDLGHARRIEARSITTQPRWSSGAPSKLPSGEASTPAAQRVTATSMRELAPLASASTQPGPMAVTWVWVWTSTPRRRRAASALAERSSDRFPERAANPRAAGRADFEGSMWRKSWRI